MRINYTQPILTQQNFTVSFGAALNNYTYYREGAANINKIFDTPIEKRSSHLKHEIHPETRKPISGRFKLKASDGAEIVVSKAIAGSANSTVKYIAISISKGNSSQTIRIDLNTGHVIKAGYRNPKDTVRNKVEYFNGAELQKNKTKETLQKYLPEILRFKSGKIQEMETAVIKHTPERKGRPQGAMRVDFWKSQILRNKKLGDNASESFSLESLEKLPSRNIEYKNKEAKKLDMYSNDIEKIISIDEKYRAFLKTLPIGQRAVFNRQVSGNENVSYGIKAIVFKTSDAGEELRVYCNHKSDLCRLSIHDKNGEVKRGYLIYEGDKLVANFNPKSNSSVPSSFKYVNEEQFQRVKSMFESDLELAKQKMIGMDKQMDDFVV